MENLAGQLPAKRKPVQWSNGIATNPLIGAGWGASSPNNPTPFSQPLFSPVATPPPGPTGNPANLPNAGSNTKDNTRNAGFENVITGQLRNQLIPLFSNAMSGTAGPAADFFKKLMDLGSPYYKQAQTQAFTQGVKDNQDAAAQAQQRLKASGYGNTPSGANAGMIGGMAMQGSQNLAEQFLQQLFQNKNLQATGAQGLESIAALFNPSNLFGNVATPGSTQGPSAADQFATIMKSLFTGGSPGGSGGN